MEGAEAQNEYVDAPVEDGSASTPSLQDPTTSHEAPRTRGGFEVDDEDEDEEYTPVVPNPGQANDDTNVEESADIGRGLADGQRLEDVSTSNDLPTLPDPSSSSSLQQAHETADAVDGGQTDSVSRPDDLTVPATNGVPADPSENVPAVENAQSPSSSVQAAALRDGDSASIVPNARLPHDHVGILEDRVKEDPRGDMDAWLGLLSEYRRRNKLQEARETYDRFFKVFPLAAEQWVAYAEMELEHNDFYRVEQIFNKSLMPVPSLQLWTFYVNYVRRRHNINTDKTGQARKTVNDTFDFVLQNIGHDKDAGPVWQDYIEFIRSSPEQVGGTSWQDQQKMDTLRKVYQKAICIPTQNVNSLWKEYDAFEMGLHKQNGRKFLQEKSPSYMTARSANISLQNITRDLKRTTLPSLPPMSGFQGDIEFAVQLNIWKRWIEWEKEDPLVLKEEDEAAYKNRILSVYKQSLMALQFWPEMWYDAAEYCFANNLQEEGNDFLTQGIAANPESCLLAFMQADRIEMTTTRGQTDESLVQRGAAVRAPYNAVLDALYALYGKSKEREEAAVKKVKDGALPLEQPQENTKEEDDEDDDEDKKQKLDPAAALKAQEEAVKAGFAPELKLIGKTISAVWTALLRAMRRVQGKGGQNQTVSGTRGVFVDARKRGRLTSDFYIANALIEHYCYQDPVAAKIFERGLRLYQDDEWMALEYTKHLINTNDPTNARAVFETSVTRFASNPQHVAKAKPLLLFMHDFESKFGELSQVTKLEGRMRELFPDDPKLKLFASRFASEDVDPVTVRLVVSAQAQTRPKHGAPPTINERPPSDQNSPRPSIAAAFPPTPQLVGSPKRSLDDSDNESSQPRKIPRSESPLKGAAGRRLDAKRSQLRQEVQPNGTSTPTPLPTHFQPPPVQPPMQHGPPPLPPEIHRLLSMIPRAESYHSTTFNPYKMVDLIRNVDLSRAQLRRQDPAHIPVPQLPSQYGYPPPAYSYGR